MLKIGELELFWLRGGVFELDGGTMFGSVPRVLWAKHFPYDEDNCISLLNTPLLVRAPWGIAVIDTGLGNKLSDKLKKIFRVTGNWDVPGSLAEIGLSREDVGYVVLTHGDFDHAGGVVMNGDDGKPELTFPNALHISQRSEWEDVCAPNMRTSHSYWSQNFEGLRVGVNLQLIDGPHEVMEGLAVIPTGGHTRGHQIAVVSSGELKAVHMGDLLPTHAHFNPLWVMAYDNFPLDAIDRKEALEGLFVRQGAWFTFYHDPFMPACRFDEKGNITERLNWQ